MPNRHAPDQQRRHRSPSSRDYVAFYIGDGLPHDREEDDAWSTSGSSWDHLAGFFMSAFTQREPRPPVRPLLPDPPEYFNGEESDYVSSDAGGHDDPIPALLVPVPVPAPPAIRLPLPTPSSDLDDSSSSDSDSESSADVPAGPVRPVSPFSPIDTLDAPRRESLIEAIVALQDRDEEDALPDADTRHEGNDIWHFLWQNTAYASVKGFFINSLVSALGGYGSTALAAQAPARAMDAAIAAVQTFLAIRRVVNHGVNENKPYADLSWKAYSSEIAISSGTALVGGTIAYFNPSSNVFKRISDAVVGSAEAYQSNLVMKFSPKGEATSTLNVERGHAHLTNALKYSAKRALKEVAFPDAVAAPSGEALKGANPFIMQYLYKNLIDTLVDLLVDVYVSLAYKETAKHGFGIPYHFKDTKLATSDDPIGKRTQETLSKAAKKSGYKIIAGMLTDAATALPAAIDSPASDTVKNISGIAGMLLNGLISGEVDAHNAHNAAKGVGKDNTDEQHYVTEAAPSEDVALELISIRV